MRASADDVPVPDFADGVLRQPLPQAFSIGPDEPRRLTVALDHHDVIRIELIQECAGLGADQDLYVEACGPEQ